MVQRGRIVILNGAPRSGKSCIAEVICRSFDGTWKNLGVDRVMASTPSEMLPGIGLRPGGERPDLEPFVEQGFADLYDSIAALSDGETNVVVDVGHHDAYSRPLGTLKSAARRLNGYPAWIVGVRCPIDVIVARRESDRTGTYLNPSEDGAIPEPVLLWQAEVHRPGIYDLEVDTSQLTPEECATLINERIAAGKPTALRQIAREELWTER